MKNILLLTHVEDSFKPYFPPMYIPRLIRSCKCSKYDQILHATSYIDDDRPIDELIPFIDEEFDWYWGYEPEMFENEHDKEWVIESSGHEWTFVPERLRPFYNWDDVTIYLGGGCRTECLEDMRCVLEHLKLRYKLVDGLIYGD